MICDAYFPDGVTILDDLIWPFGFLRSKPMAESILAPILPWVCSRFSRKFWLHCRIQAQTRHFHNQALPLAGFSKHSAPKLLNVQNIIGLWLTYLQMMHELGFELSTRVPPSEKRLCQDVDSILARIGLLVRMIWIAGAIIAVFCAMTNILQSGRHFNPFRSLLASS